MQNKYTQQTECGYTTLLGKHKATQRGTVVSAGGLEENTVIVNEDNGQGLGKLNVEKLFATNCQSYLIEDEILAEV